MLRDAAARSHAAREKVLQKARYLQGVPYRLLVPSEVSAARILGSAAADPSRSSARSVLDFDDSHTPLRLSGRTNLASPSDRSARVSYDSSLDSDPPSTIASPATSSRRSPPPAHGALPSFQLDPGDKTANGDDSPPFRQSSRIRPGRRGAAELV